MPYSTSGSPQLRMFCHTLLVSVIKSSIVIFYTSLNILFLLYNKTAGEYSLYGQSFAFNIVVFLFTILFFTFRL